MSDVIVNFGILICASISVFLGVFISTFNNASKKPNKAGWILISTLVVGVALGILKEIKENKQQTIGKNKIAILSQRLDDAKLEISKLALMLKESKSETAELKTILNQQYNTAEFDKYFSELSDPGHKGSRAVNWFALNFETHKKRLLSKIFTGEEYDVIQGNNLAVVLSYQILKGTEDKKKSIISELIDNIDKVSESVLNVVYCRLVGTRSEYLIKKLKTILLNNNCSDLVRARVAVVLDIFYYSNYKSFDHFILSIAYKLNQKSNLGFVGFIKEGETQPVLFVFNNPKIEGQSELPPKYTHSGPREDYYQLMLDVIRVIQNSYVLEQIHKQHFCVVVYSESHSPVYGYFDLIPPFDLVKSPEEILPFMDFNFLIQSREYNNKYQEVLIVTDLLLEQGKDKILKYSDNVFKDEQDRYKLYAKIEEKFKLLPKNKDVYSQTLSKMNMEHDMYPKDLYVQYLLAKVYSISEKNEHFDLSFSLCKDAIKKTEKSKLLFNISDAYELCGSLYFDFEKKQSYSMQELVFAKKYYIKAIQNRPNNSLIYAQLGIIEILLGDKDKAISYFELCTAISDQFAVKRTVNQFLQIIRAKPEGCIEMIRDIYNVKKQNKY